MDSYSKKEFQSMQEEAIARVREMQKRAQNYIDNSNNEPEEQKEKPEEAVEQTTTQQSRPGNYYIRSRPMMNQNPLANLFGFNNQNNLRYSNIRPQSSMNSNNQKQRNNTNNQRLQNNQNTTDKNNTPQNTSPQQSNPDNNEQTPPPSAHVNNQSSPLGPFAQLFGSNLGAFNKFKKLLSKDDEDRKKPLQGFLDGLLKDFNIDEEKIILGVLIYLLYKNGSDVKLLLALGYLLL